MSRKGESVTISLSTSEQEKLEKLAFEMDCTWGSKGNISALMRAIASGEITLQSVDNSTLSNKEKNLVEKAMKILSQVIN